jgi:hypothetical protein
MISSAHCTADSGTDVKSSSMRTQTRTRTKATPQEVVEPRNLSPVLTPLIENGKISVRLGPIAAVKDWLNNYQAFEKSPVAWQSARRFESPAPAFETRGTEDRNTLAQLAHSQAPPRYFVADSGSFPETCASTTWSQQDVHNARALHGADSRALARSSRKPFAIGEEW